MHEQVNAVLAAGGMLPEELAGLHKTGIKALAEVRGASLLDHSLRALSELERDHGVQVGEISLIGASPVRDHVDGEYEDKLTWDSVGENGVENVKRGLDLHDMERPTLLMATDLALVDGGMLKRFVESVPAEAELAFPLVDKQDFQNRFPDAPNRFERIGDEHFTMGSVLFCRPAAFMRNYPLFTDAFEHRKTPYKLALLFGLDIVFKWLLGLADLNDLEERASRLCDARVTAVRGMAPELAYDVDEQQNLDYLKQLESKSPQPAMSDEVDAEAAAKCPYLSKEDAQTAE